MQGNQGFVSQALIVIPVPSYSTDDLLFFYLILSYNSPPNLSIFGSKKKKNGLLIYVFPLVLNMSSHLRN